LHITPTKERVRAAAILMCRFRIHGSG
jgi:hypothetical protein